MTKNPMDRRIFFMLTRAGRELNKSMDRYLMKHVGITLAQMGALFFLMKNNGCLLKELSKGLALNNSAITGLVGRMETNGLVTREACHDDRRAFRIFITEKGREIAGKGFPLVAKMNAAMTRLFAPSEIDVIVRFLNGIVTMTEGEMEKI